MRAANLYRAGEYRDATVLLARVLKEEPAVRLPDWGSAWYLLGRCLLALDSRDRAFNVWSRGIQTLQKFRVFDPRLTYDFILLGMELRKSESYQRFTELYYELLQHLETESPDSLLPQLFSRVEFLLPEEQRLELSKQQNPEERTRFLRNYWRRQDPTPATLVNERLLEHLQRVQYSLQHFALANRRGFDDRGMMYVKLGPPDRQMTYEWGVATGQFRPHEIWNYDSIANQLYYFFVDLQKGQGFQITDRLDQAIYAVPRIAERQQLYYELARVQTSIYRRLYDLRTPSVVYDFEDEEYRYENTPDVKSNALRDVGELPLFTRALRFENGDGSTRVETLMGFRKKDLLIKKVEPLMPTDSLIVQLNLVLEDQQNWPVSRKTQRVSRFTGDDPLNEEMVYVRVPVNASADSFYVSGQLEDWLRREGTTFEEESNALLRTVWTPQPQVSKKLLRLASFRTERLQKIVRGTELALSDIELSSKIVPDAENPTAHKGGLYVAPYPYSRVKRDSLVYLYFEIYNLHPDDQGTAHYRVGYQAEDLRTRQSIWSRIKSAFGGRPEGRLELESEYTADTPNPSEWIALDVSALPKGEIRLTVTAEDMLSGQKTERAITIELY